jgi:hypothetical protein
VFNSSDSLQNNFKKVKEHFYYLKEMAQYITWPFFLIIYMLWLGVHYCKIFFFYDVFFCCPRLGIETLPLEEGLTSHLPEV